MTDADEPIIYRARATRWDGGWELHVEGVGVTQVSSLDTAEQQVRDYIETEMGLDTTGAEIAIDKADPLTRNISESMDKGERPDQ